MLRFAKQSLIRLMPAISSMNYRLYFLGQSVSRVGSWFTTIALQWLVYPTLTSNKSYLGLVSTLHLAPAAIFILFGGVLADRVNKRVLTIWLQILLAITSFLLFFLIISRQIQVWHVFVFALFTGVIVAFDLPVRKSFMIASVPKAIFSSAISLDTASFNITRAIGPAAAGLTIAALGLGPAFLIDTLTFLAVIYALYLMQSERYSYTKLQQPFFKEFAGGFHYILEHRVIAALLLLTALITFFSWPLATLLPVFAHDIFKTGEVGFGLLQSAFGLGAGLTAVGFNIIFKRVTNKFELIVACSILESLQLLLFSVVNFFPLALLFEFIAGIATTIVFASANTIIQEITPDSYRGRMMSFYYFVVTLSMPAAALVTSYTVVILGARATVFNSAIALLLSFLLVVIFMGKRLRLRLNTTD